MLMENVTQSFALKSERGTSRHADQSRQTFTIALMAFLTVVDLFAAQAILPSLTAHFHVMPAQMAVAVNASTVGMAIASLAVALFSSKIDRRKGIVLSLAFLAIPTALLAHASDLEQILIIRHHSQQL